MSPGARKNLEILRALDIDIHYLSSEKDIVELLGSLVSFDLIVDAVYGTGFKGSLNNLSRMVFKLVNNSYLPVLSIDIPSGVDSDTGLMDKDAIKADYTFTLGLPKLGIVLEPAASEQVGELIVENISIPPALLEQAELKHNLLTPAEVRSLLPLRHPVSHKGDYGHVLLLGGSVNMRGAIALSGGAAIRSGAGMVTLAVPQALLSAFPNRQPELMFWGLDTDEQGFIAAHSLDKIRYWQQRVSVVAVGPGLGAYDEALKIVDEVMSWDKQRLLVIDADGLNALQGNTELLQQARSPLVITPHPGEMSRLTGLTIAEIQGNRIDVARQYAAEWNTIIVLKGHKTVVAEPDGQIYINTRGNSGMATAGSGDVLTGVIAGLAAQGSTPLEAALAGVFVHAVAGDLAAEQVGERSLTASDIITGLSPAFIGLEKSRKG